MACMSATAGGVQRMRIQERSISSKGASIFSLNELAPVGQASRTGARKLASSTNGMTASFTTFRIAADCFRRFRDLRFLVGRETSHELNFVPRAHKDTAAKFACRLQIMLR